MTYSDSATLYNAAETLYGVPNSPPYWSVLVRWDGISWDEIGHDVRQITWQRGSSGDFGSMEPGTFAIRLQNSADRYLPTNPSSPLFGLLRAGADVLVRCLYQDSYLRVASGYVRSIKPAGSWIPSERMTEIVGDDALGAWNRRDVTLPAQRAGISIRGARDAVLDLLGVAAGRRVMAEESSTIQYGELVTIRDELGVVLSTFEAGLNGTPLQLLDALNAAGLGRHYIKPGTTTAVPWQYTSTDRHHKLEGAADATMTYGTDYDGLDGWNVNDETRLSRVTVKPKQHDDNLVEAVAGVAGANEATLSSDLMPSKAHAQGVADNLQWRFNAERPRPQMLLQRRMSQMFTRDLFDVIEFTDSRYYLTDRRMEIVGISGTWGPGPMPQVTWTLQDAPQQAPLSTLFTLGRDALGGAAVLGR